jgi:hypothetical protein
MQLIMLLNDLHTNQNENDKENLAYVQIYTVS